MYKKIIFVTGGVISSLGKGIAASAIGCILKIRDFNINIKKVDLYLNVDPGTMNPTQHGEVFVTEDGLETDLDLGHYERFTGIKTTKENNITAGKIYQNLIENERKGTYLGKTIQVIPHVTDLIKEFILKNVENFDFTIVEIGGTVGDIECEPFLETIRQISQDNIFDSMFVHLTFIPYLKTTKEIKTKPTQHSVRELMRAGIRPDIILCRTEVTIDENSRKKIALFCNTKEEFVIDAPDVEDIYHLPYLYEKNGISRAVLGHFKLDYKNLREKLKNNWSVYLKREIINTDKRIRIIIPGKYTDLEDSYKSLSEAIKHAAYNLKLDYKIDWIDVKENNFDKFAISDNSCIIIPGGFGSEGIDGKLEFIKYARENNIPFLGICYGMQLAVIEFARNVLNLDCNTTEIDKNTKNNIVDIISNWKDEKGSEKSANLNKLGGTMRLGGYKINVLENTLAYDLYNSSQIIERHRHRYDVNSKYIKQIEEKGAKFSGFSSINPEIPEIFEIKNWTDENGNKKTNDFFIGGQFHPELISDPIQSHPLFLGLLSAIKMK